MKKTSVGLLKIRKKYRFDLCVLNIKEDISYTKIPLIYTGFADFFNNFIDFSWKKWLIKLINHPLHVCDSHVVHFEAGYPSNSNTISYLPRELFNRRYKMSAKCQIQEASFISFFEGFFRLDT